MQRVKRARRVVAVIGATALDEQHVPSVVAGEPVDRRGGHLGQRRFAGGVLRALGLEAHVRGLEQAQDLPRRAQIERGELAPAPHEGASGPRGLPRRGEIPAVGAPPAHPRILRIGRARGKELRAPAAERDVDPVSGREFDELARDIALASRGRFGGQIGVALPVAVRRMGVGRRRRRMGEARRRDDAGGEAARFGCLEQRAQALVGPAHFAEQRRRVEVENAGARLHPGEHRGGGARRVGHLLVRVVGLEQRDVRQPLEREPVLFTAAPALLAVEDARADGRANPAPAVRLRSHTRTP